MWSQGGGNEGEAPNKKATGGLGCSLKAKMEVKK